MIRAKDDYWASCARAIPKSSGIGGLATNRQRGQPELASASVAYLTLSSTLSVV